MDEKSALGRIAGTFELVDHCHGAQDTSTNNLLQRILRKLRRVWAVCVRRWVRCTARALSHITTITFRLHVDAEYVIKDGMVLWDVSGSEEPVENPAGFRNFILRHDKISSGAILKSAIVQDDRVTSSLRVPLDIILLYQDKDPDTLRKLELAYGVRVFWGRDFEKFRDRDRPFAPRGTNKLCFHGRYEDVMDAKAEVVRWVELQEDFAEEEILVAEHAIGNVIGRQGSRVAQMQVESGAKIDVERQGSRKGEFVQVMISGRKPARTSARRLIQECLDHSERMRERDRIKENIRDVQRRIMYHESEEEQDNPYPSTIENQYENSICDDRQSNGDAESLNESFSTSSINEDRLSVLKDGGDDSKTTEVSPWDGRYTVAAPRAGRTMRMNL